MAVLAIINAKGGSGKSTVATSISAYAAKAGVKLMLGDLDPQQSVRTWLRLRKPELPVISGWLLDAGRVFRPPPGVTHAILDTPSGLNGYHLARVVMASNLVIVPVAASAFDREAAQECIENLRRLPRVISGLCVIACLGMRIPQGSPTEKITRAWAEKLDIKFLGVVRYSPCYSTLVDSGSSIFDDAAKETAGLRNDWKPLLDWLNDSYFGSLIKPEVLRTTHKIIDQWPRPVPSLASFQAARTAPEMPFVAAPAALVSHDLLVPNCEAVAPLEPAAPLGAGVNVLTEALVDPELDELAADELVLLVVDGELDVSSPSTGFLSSVTKSFKRMWGP